MSEYAAQITADWNILWKMINSYDGAGASEFMIERRKNAFPVWNALRQQVNKWMYARFGRRELTKSEQEIEMSKWEIGRARYIAFLCKIYHDRHDPVTWNSEDLRYMLQEIREGAADENN